MSKIVGAHTYGAEKIKLFYRSEHNLVIGKYCSISRGCRVFLGGNHHSEWISTYPLVKKSSSSKGDVTIKNDVWIGYGVTILSGVTIGDGAIVGAMSVVTKDVDPYALVGGNPATLKKYRFDQDTINKLLQIKWWDRDESFVAGITPYLMSQDVDGFLAHIDSARTRGTYDSK
jgi:acetyltransferase-like isoleucine patch superfamily enzyme